MANAYSGFFPTLVAALDDAQKALDAPNRLMQSCYQDFSTQTASLYDTINLNLPASTGAPSNVGAGSLTYTDVVATPKSVQLNQHPAYGFALPDYDAIRTMNPMQVRALFADEAIKKMGVFCNQYIAALLTAGNFPQVVAGASADTITPAEASAMWRTLAEANVSVRDAANLFFLTHPVVYANILPDTTWTGGNTVSQNVAEDARLNARLRTVFGAAPDFDLDMPVATGVYTSIMFHRNALAMAARALPSPDAGGVASMQYIYKGLPIRITIDWNQQKLAYTITFDALFGASVFRANHLCRHTST